MLQTIFLILATAYETIGSHARIENSSRQDHNIKDTSIVLFDHTSNAQWADEFELVEIPAIDGQVQKAYFYRSLSTEPQPLVLSLHTWSGNFTQADPLAGLCLAKDLNYIHPDFRGPNNTIQACCSELALSDLDNSIDFAIEHTGVKPSGIYVIGLSGGGYATLGMLMHSKHRINKFSAWAPISDLAAWYRESSIRGNSYAGDVLNCTGSVNGQLNESRAKERSPLYWKTPAGKFPDTEVIIHAGVYDGIQGSVPITHSINFYNKLITDLGNRDSTALVSLKETLLLLEYRLPIGDFGSMAGRRICLQKQYQSIKLIIFEGNHEMLPEYALDELLLSIAPSQDIVNKH